MIRKKLHGCLDKEEREIPFRLEQEDQAEWHFIGLISCGFRVNLIAATWQIVATSLVSDTMSAK